MYVCPGIMLCICRVLPSNKVDRVGRCGLDRVCVTTSITLVIHQRKTSEEGIEGHSAERAWGEHCTTICVGNVLKAVCHGQYIAYQRRLKLSSRHGGQMYCCQTLRWELARSGRYCTGIGRTNSSSMCSRRENV